MKRNVVVLALMVLGASCSKNNNNGYGYGTTPPPTPPAPVPVNFVQTNLVADVADYIPGIVDPKLVNAWGIAVNPNGIVWVADNHSGASTVYDSTGKTLLGPVGIQSQGSIFGGSPSGVVFNSSTTDFIIPQSGLAAKFIFDNEDGTISAWAGGDSTITVASWPADAVVYKGLAIATDGGANFLYATDFKGGKIDVFDKGFNYSGTRQFKDPNIPAGYGPFNIQNIGGKLYVTYAKLKGPDNEDDQAGAGNGYVDIFNPDGSFVSRFASQGTLNSPWGIVQTPASSGLPLHSILVGNFGDGHINCYDSTGVYKGQLQSNGHVITIEGLWGLNYPVNENPKSDPTKMYFTAGPMDESHGIFGVLKAQ